MMMAGILRKVAVTVAGVSALLVFFSPALAEDQWNRDPFQYKGKSGQVRKTDSVNKTDEVVEETTEIVLKGIFRNSGGAYVAIINGQPYKAGDTIGKARIVKVMRYQIRVSEAGRIRSIQLFGKHLKWGRYEN